MFVKVHTGAISGIEAVEVTVEVNVAQGGLGLFLVGLPDNTIKESEQRIHAAFENSGYKLLAKKPPDAQLLPHLTESAMLLCISFYQKTYDVYHVHNNIHVYFHYQDFYMLQGSN